MSLVINARGLTKIFRDKAALNNFSFELEKGKILGLIGPNGAGKTTALRCLMGMATCHGELQVLGKDPVRDRMSLLSDVAYIADTAILPAWMTVSQLLEYTQGVHPKFSRQRAVQFLEKTDVRLKDRISTLSKGMVTQTHLALAISIDAKLLVLDEPTLGLDILYRKTFYEQLLNDYFDEGKTILITTHQVEEIEHVLTDLLFIKNGSAVLNMSMEELSYRYVDLEVDDGQIDMARLKKPIAERAGIGARVFTYEDVPRQELEGLGKLSTPSVADLFVAKMS